MAPAMNTKQAKQDILRFRRGTAYWTPQNIIMSITMIQHLDGVFLTILLSILGYNFEGNRILLPHVNSYRDPVEEIYTLTDKV